MTAQPQKVIRWWHFALIGVMIMMFILFAAGLGRDTKFIPSPLVGKPAFDFDLKQLGKESNIKLSDYKGKIVILNFWASWCVTCREEHHVLLEAANALQPKGTVQFLGVNSKDTDKGAFGFMDKRGHFPYPSVIDRQGRMALEYGVYGMPETFFINKDGVIAAKHIGALTHKILADKLKQAEAVQ